MSLFRSEYLVLPSFWRARDLGSLCVELLDITICYDVGKNNASPLSRRDYRSSRLPNTLRRGNTHTATQGWPCKQPDATREQAGREDISQLAAHLPKNLAKLHVVTNDLSKSCYPRYTRSRAGLIRRINNNTTPLFCLPLLLHATNYIFQEWQLFCARRV